MSWNRRTDLGFCVGVALGSSPFGFRPHAGVRAPGARTIAPDRDPAGGRLRSEWKACSHNRGRSQGSGFDAPPPLPHFPVCSSFTILNVAPGFSFEVVNALDYDALRPNYAPEAVAWVAGRGGLGKGSCVVDLAAGTGQLSKRFATLGVTLLAVEPARNMRSVIEERLPTVRALEGSAEAIPVPDGAADAIVVGNAFHHFNEGPAFEEIRRVLRLSGVLAVFWAWPAEQEVARYPRLQELEDLVSNVVKDVPAAEGIVTAYRKWVTRLPRVHGFSAFERREFPTTHVVPSARLADLYATSSDVASLPTAVRADLLLRIREISRDLPEVLQVPARSVVDVCTRE